MKNEMVKKYIEEIPIELRNATKALSDDKKWAVFIALVKEGEMSFNILKTLFGAHPQEIDRVLKNLTSAGLVRKYVVKLEDVGNKERTFYEVTEFGKDFLDSLYYSLIPKEEIVREWWERFSENPSLFREEYYRLYSGTQPIIMKTDSSMVEGNHEGK